MVGEVLPGRHAAAHRLGYINNGSTMVEVEAIIPGKATTISYDQVKPPSVTNERDGLELLSARLAKEESPSLPPQPAAALPPAGIYLQMGAFASTDNAESLRSHLARELDWLREAVRIVPGGHLFRLQIGPYANRGAAEQIAERIRIAYGQKPTFVTH